MREGSPPGLAAVFVISGGTALMIAAFATRLSPWRASFKAAPEPS